MKVNEVEAEVIRNLNNQNSLEDLFLLSSGSPDLTNLILAKILNQQHHFRAVDIPNSCPLHKSLAA